MAYKRRDVSGKVFDAVAETVPSVRNSAPESESTERYALLERLGEGGMGVVWEAHDRTLDRRVALKVLHDQYLGADYQARLAGEARAMARLHHPNVVAVYDVGEREGRTFVTMELVRGQPLSRWLGTPRSWREVVEVFRGAGAGLAAAHEAGIVHRDIKPSNILLGEDGVAKVADFGVAHAAQIASPAGVAVGAVTAGIIGSPLYMSPERLSGEPADERGDQFSFCASLYEALHGKRPFEADTLEGLRAAILAGVPEPVRDVPRWLHAVVARGLAADPAARFPSMRELLVALQGPRRRRWIFAALGTAGVAATIASLVLLRDDAAGPSCNLGTRALAGVWDDTVKKQLVDAFGATGADFAEDAAREAVRLLDRYAAEWAQMHEAACRATHVERSQTVEMFQRRQLCLERRRHDLQRAVEALVQDRELVEKAPRLVRGLAPIADCGDPAYLERLVAAPSSTADDLALARIHLYSGRYAEGIPVADRVVSAAQASGDRTLEVAALTLRGRLEGLANERARAIDTLQRAAELAATLEAPRLRAEALLHLSGDLQAIGQLPAAAEMLDVADGLLAATPDPRLEAHAASLRGTLLGRQTRYRDAIPHFERALAKLSEVYGPQSEALAPALSNLALALRRSGRLDEALPHLRRAREVTASLGETHPHAIDARRELALAMMDSGARVEAERELRAVLELLQRVHRDDHPDLARAWSDLGVSLSSLGRHEEALEAFQRAVAIRTRLAPDARETLMDRGNVADTLSELGRVAEAEPILREILVARRQTLGAVHGEVARGHRQLAAALHRLGRTREAAREFDAARRIYTALGGVDHPEIANLLDDRAVLEREAGRYAAALAFDREALAIRERVYPAGHRSIAQSLVSMARNMTGLGRHAVALSYAERAVVAAGTREELRAPAGRWLLAQVIEPMPGAAQRARALAIDARRMLAGRTEPEVAQAIAEIDEWLAARGGGASPQEVSR